MNSHLVSLLGKTGLRQLVTESRGTVLLLGRESRGTVLLLGRESRGTVLLLDIRPKAK